MTPHRDVLRNLARLPPARAKRALSYWLSRNERDRLYRLAVRTHGIVDPVQWFEPINTAARLAIETAINEGFRFRVEIANAGDLSPCVAWFCKTIEEARQAFRANRNKGNMALVIEHFSGSDLGNNRELFCGFIH